MLCRIIIITCITALLPVESFAFVKGIYVTQPTLESTRRVKYLIRRAKQLDIDTFVIDLTRKSRLYKKNIALVKRNGIRYVVRIVVFPYGGSHQQVSSKAYWDKKLKLIKYAHQLGVNEVQLDYIRYRVKSHSSKQKAYNVLKVIKYFKHHTDRMGVPLQLAVFGETTTAPSNAIGQNLKVFHGHFDVLNPMTYPSHYEPFRFHATRPYQTVNKSLKDLRKQFGGSIPFRVYPYIELYNYRYAMSAGQKQQYIHAQIKAIQDNKMDGWYAWSPQNKYHNLFRVMERYRLR